MQESRNAQVLFVNRAGLGLIVDCVVADEQSGLSFPLAIMVRPPETFWFAELVESLLSRWAEECTVVRIAADEHRPALHLESGTSRLTLEYGEVAA